VATALILLFTTKYRSTYCAGHLPVDLGAETEQVFIDQQVGGLGREVRVDSVAPLGRGEVAVGQRR
jgi:hypothetical protein